LIAASDELARERQKIAEAAEPLLASDKLTAAQEQLTEELVSTQKQAQSQFATLAQSVAAELAEARSQLTAAREELALERQRISGAAEPLLSAAAAAVSAAAAAPRVVETAPPVRMPDAVAPIESAPPTPATPAAPPAQRHSADTQAPVATKPDAAAPSEDETAGWWGELQQLRRGLSKAVQPQADAPPRRTKTSTPS
jgi:hypothetical protein